MVPTDLVTVVATVNRQKISIIQHESEKFVPLRPICDALDLNFSGQIQRLNRDEILSSVVCMIHTTGSDKKQYEMACIPFKFVFGWLFTIDTAKVKPEAQKFVLQYKLECYDALYNHFTGYAEFVEYRQRKIDEKLTVLQETRSEFNSAKEQLKQAQEELDNVRAISWDDYKRMKSQMQIDFNDEVS
jgi:hypothetical protein